jgi:hypothetical protein
MSSDKDLGLLGINEASNAPLFRQVLTHSVNDRDGGKCWLLVEYLPREFLVMVYHCVKQPYRSGFVSLQLAVIPAPI